MENVLIVSAKTHEWPKAGETISGLFCWFRTPCTGRSVLQARLGNLFTYPPGNGCFGTPVYSLVYIFAGEAIFQALKKPVSYVL